MDIVIIGTNDGANRLLVAPSKKEYQPDTPVAIWTSPNTWDSMKGRLTLGMAYKFGLWYDPTPDIELPEGMPEKTRKYLLGEL